MTANQMLKLICGICNYLIPRIPERNPIKKQNFHRIPFNLKIFFELKGCIIPKWNSLEPEIATKREKYGYKNFGSQEWYSRSKSEIYRQNKNQVSRLLIEKSIYN